MIAILGHPQTRFECSHQSECVSAEEEENAVHRGCRWVKIVAVKDRLRVWRDRLVRRSREGRKVLDDSIVARELIRYRTDQSGGLTLSIGIRVGVESVGLVNVIRRCRHSEPLSSLDTHCASAVWISCADTT